MENLLQKLREKGYKMTPQRRAVVTALLECGEFPSAQTILEHVKHTLPDVSLDTIYRNLALLVELGLVQEIHLRGRESNVFELTVTHHHHLVCLSCGKTLCLDHCPIDHRDVAKAAKQGFEIVSHSLEFYGYCRTCRIAG
ncbi:MAG TPA: Fur family transcriptional regulator [Selenomonadales bacterium]|nr:Fur family transcriptional regulator [Selenomonadales bacterium]